MNNLSVGLLPLSLEELRRSVDGMADRQRAFVAAVADSLGREGMRVAVAPVCCARADIAGAVRRFGDQGVDAVFLLALSYTPSLESVPVLAEARLPLVVLDTTPNAEFRRVRDATELMHNHGIHAVQDLCNVLLRDGVRFEIVAGHGSIPGYWQRCASMARGACMARIMDGLRVGRVGGTFTGMGDIAFPTELEAAAGPVVVDADPREIIAMLPGEQDHEVTRELTCDRRSFQMPDVDPSIHAGSIRTGIAFRRWIEAAGLAAFTINPVPLHRAGLVPLPFLEASKAMSRGIGYAGEGDAFTAALAAAVMASFGTATFTEMFCPDWRSGRLLLSHTAEVNPRLCDRGVRLIDRRHAVTGVVSTAAVGSLRPGMVTLVNVSAAPAGAGARFRVIVVRGESERDRPRGTMRDTVRGWLRPRLPLPRLLEEYSELGGSHHLVLVYGDVADGFRAFARFRGWDFRLIA